MPGDPQICEHTSSAVIFTETFLHTHLEVHSIQLATVFSNPY